MKQMSLMNMQTILHNLYRRKKQSFFSENIEVTDNQRNEVTKNRKKKT